MCGTRPALIAPLAPPHQPLVNTAHTCGRARQREGEREKQGDTGQDARRGEEGGREKDKERKSRRETVGKGGK